MTSIVPKSPALIAGVIFVLAMTLVGIFAPLLAPHDPAEINMFERNISPGESIKHPLGTDLFGRDMLSRLIHSLRIPVILGGAALLLGTVSSLVLIGLGARSRVFKNTGQLPSEGFLNHSLLRVAGPVFLIGPFLGLFVLAILGSGLLTVALVVVPFAALPPLSLISCSVRSRLALLESSTEENTAWLPVRIAFREGMVLIPITYSLAFLMGMLLETPLSFLGLGIPPGESSLGNMIAEGRSRLIDLWWVSLLPLGVVALSVGAFLGIVLPIRRVQKQSDLFVQPDLMAMSYAGFWIRIGSITIDIVAQIVIGIIILIPFSFGFHENLFAVLLIAFWVLYTLFFLGGRWDSLGHRLLGIRVVRSNGERVGFVRSIVRGFLIFALPIGVWAIPFTRRRQALHDLLPDTVVVKRDSLREDEPRVCPHCGIPTAAASNFCIECGTELAR